VNSDSREDLKKALAGWLSHEGYPLEMLTARTFLRSGFGVRQGWHYDDPETGKHREQDVLATQQIHQGNILVFQVIVECKRSIRPFVAFTYGPQFSKRLGESWNPVNPLGRELLRRLKSEGIFDRIPLYEESSPVAYSVVQAAIAMRNEKRSPGHGVDAAYDAIMTVVKASYSLSQLYSEKVRTIPTAPGSEEHAPVAYLGVPLLVVDAPLFECYLDDENEPALNPVDELIVEWSYPAVGNLTLKLVTMRVLDEWVRKAWTSVGILNSEARGILSSLRSPPHFASA